MVKERKTVWLVNPYCSPTIKRTRQIVLSQRLEEQGYNVFIVCSSHIHGSDENLIKDNRRFYTTTYDGAKFIVIKTGGYQGNGVKRVLNSIQFQQAVYKLRNRLPRPDVIVSDFAGLFGNIFLRFKNKYGTKIIYDILDLWPEQIVDVGFVKKDSLPARIMYKMEHKAYRDADGIIFSFEGGKEYIIEKGWAKCNGGDVDTDKVGYLNNGVDLETVDWQKDNLILDDPDLETDKFKVAYLGSIRKANDLDIIIDAAKILQDKGEDNIEILIYGDGDHRHRLEDKSKELGLKNVKFKGRLLVEYAPNMLSRCDINIFNFMNTPIARFGFSPNKLFMYFSSGKPILATVKPNYDLVSGRECGITVENTPEAAAEGIIQFSEMNKTEYERFAQNCRSVAKEFDYKNLVFELIKQIEGDNYEH